MNKWCIELKQYLEETKEFQVIRFLQDYKIDLNKAIVQHMKDWIQMTKDIRKNYKSYKKGDIQHYFYKKRRIKKKIHKGEIKNQKI